MARIGEGIRNLMDENHRRNMVIGLYAILTGLVLIWIGYRWGIGYLDSIIGLESGVRIICAVCILPLSLYILVGISGFSIIGKTIQRLRKNWDDPRKIGIVELIRRSMGFVLFSFACLGFWRTAYNPDWLSGIIIGLVLMAPLTDSWLKAMIPFAGIIEEEDSSLFDHQRPIVVFIESIKLLLILLAILISIILAVYFFRTQITQLMDVLNSL
jgi:hypothetical protein